MSNRRILMIGLDGFEPSLAESWMQQGEMPNLARLYQNSANFALDHGRAKYSGLAWEHVSSGLSPADSGRWSAVTFNTSDYSVRQDPTSMRPFFADITSPTVIFDTPYCDLSQAPNVMGMTNWGAHDPGVPTYSRPGNLQAILRERFGPYPAPEWIYGMAWPSVDKTKHMSDALVRAVDTRSQAAVWLLGEHLPDWQLAMVVVSECHSGIEALWHGIDPEHPLHGIASAPVAARGMRRIYRAIDKLIGDLVNNFPDATIVAFGMHGMGANNADIASMVLLPELLYRNAFGKSYLRSRQWPVQLPDTTPLLDETFSWNQAMREAIPGPKTRKQRLLRLFPKFGQARQSASPPLDWMPAARYRSFWSHMPAFALPSFYDGRIRINLRDRESHGKVSRSNYAAKCEELVELLQVCRDLQTDRPIIDTIVRGADDPMQLTATEADLYITWQGAPLGLSHPVLGDIGPIPYRRTGGHTGPYGFLCTAGEGIRPTDRGITSSFNVVPTVLDLLGETIPQHISGQSLATTLFN
ncbi:putative AlkP superfamily phosphohydrolase/phosphomutase [Methylohalomonas lacus]|uniref:AlkP superfamily phosphohydrolase/phosphomutase n=1 Tax=Methylohalomonas lacus TaxID=398773 RepID=A0AAE3HLD4_9GAMM|nr:alkaline phosphatase family protein [Methylohalomonas lacus]MCS3903363.1 putative AlkP superfamily phosphohydrolase/phosphomutase [Methylohalomonas lacus]